MARGSKAGSPKTGGRKKGTPNATTAEIKSLALAYGPAALKAVAIMAGVAEANESHKAAETDQVRILALREILDRAYGRPSQALSVDPGDQFLDMMKEFLASIDGTSRGLPQNRDPAAEIRADQLH